MGFLSNVYRAILISVSSLHCNPDTNSDCNEAMPFFSTIYAATELIVAAALLGRAFPLISPFLSGSFVFSILANPNYIWGVVISFS